MWSWRCCLSLLSLYKASSSDSRVTALEYGDDPTLLTSGFGCSIPRQEDSEAPPRVHIIRRGTRVRVKIHPESDTGLQWRPVAVDHERGISLRVLNGYCEHS